MSYTASVCILTVISLERYVAIIYPMHSRRLHSMMLLRATIIGVWTVAGVSGLPYVYIYDTIDITDVDGSLLQFCIIFHSFNIRAYTSATFMLWYVVPLALMAFVYSRISVVLWRSSHGPRVTTSTPAVQHHDADVPDAGDVSSTKPNAVVSTDATSAGRRLMRRLGLQQQQQQPTSARHDHLTTSPQCLITVEPSSDDVGHGSAIELRSLTSGREARRAATALTSSSDQTALSARRKVIRLLIAVVVSFAVCVLPYHVRVLWQAFSEPQLTDWQLVIPPLTFVLYYLNSGLNPLLYALLSNNFRSSLSDVLCCRCSAATSTHAARVTYDTRGGHITVNTRATVRTPSVN